MMAECKLHFTLMSASQCAYIGRTQENENMIKPSTVSMMVSPAQQEVRKPEFGACKR